MGDVCEEWARDRWEKFEPVEDSAQSVCLHIGVDVLRKLELVDEKDAAAVEIKFAITAEPWQVRLDRIAFELAYIGLCQSNSTDI